MKGQFKIVIINILHFKKLIYSIILMYLIWGPMLENIIVDNQIIKLLRRNQKIVTVLIEEQIHDDLELAKFIIKVFDLNLIDDIYFRNLCRSTLSGRKNVELRNKEIKYSEIMSLFLLFQSIISSSLLTDSEKIKVCTILKHEYFDV